MSQPKTVLVIDDDKRLRQLLSTFLKKQGFQVAMADSGQEGLTWLEQSLADIIVLDVMMPGMSGHEVAQHLKQSATLAPIPILMLTALGETEDRIQGLTLGADDYLSKPFDPRELLLRLQKLMERSGPLTHQINPLLIYFGERVYDSQKEILMHQGTPVYLTSAEHLLLKVLTESLEQPLTRDFLAACCGVTLSPRTIDVQITRLRRKLEEDPRQPLYLRTVRHKGYGLWPSHTA